jgi:hypothetical protein
MYTLYQCLLRVLSNVDATYIFFSATCLLHHVELYVQDLFKDTFLSVERRRVLKDTSIATCNRLVSDTHFHNVQSLKKGGEMAYVHSF